MVELLFLSAGICLVLLVRVSGGRKAPGAVPFLVLLGGIFCYNLGYGLELITPVGGPLPLWNHLQYLGVAAFPAAWLWFCLEVPRQDRLPDPFLPGAFFLEAVVTLVLNLTNDFHHFYYASLSWEPFGGVTRALIVPGPWYQVHVAFTLISFPLGILLFFLAWRRSPRARWSNFAAIALACLPTLGGFVAYQAHWVPGGLDTGPLGLAATALLFFWLLFSFDPFSLRPLAKEAVFRLVRVPVLVVGEGGVLLDWNPASEGLFPGLRGLAGPQVLARAAAGLPEWEAALGGAAPQDGLLFRGPGLGWWTLRSSPVGPRNGRAQAWVCLFHEQTDLVTRMEASETRALVDSLTGCLSRQAFLDRARAFETRPLALLFLDLDHFKALNDSQGHAAGDAALVHAVKLWQGRLRPADLLGRLGGEEFGLALPDTSLDEALDLGRRLLEVLRAQPLGWEGATVALTASIGAAAGDGSVSLDTLLRRADTAMYEAKDAGRDRIAAYRPEVPHASSSLPATEADVDALLPVYNHYVLTDTATFHTEPIDRATFRGPPPSRLPPVRRLDHLGGRSAGGVGHPRPVQAPGGLRR